MRITNKMLSNNFLRDMRTNLTNLKTLQEQMTSGKAVRRPSDNPFKVARAMQLHTEINLNKQYNENIKDTLNWLDTTDTALGQAGDIFHRIRELLISSGNGAYSEGERKAIKDEINEKISEFSQVMNTNFDGKYIFGGTRGTTKPMDTAAGINDNTRLFYYKKGGGELLNGAEYQQIGEKLKVEISQGVDFTYNVSAKDIIEFKNATGQAKDLRDIFKNIVNHLDGKNEDGTDLDADSVKKLVNEDLKDISDTMNNILKLRSEVGAKQNSMESASEKNKDQNFNMTEILSKTEDIDITETTMQFATAQTVYIASLQTSARVLQPTLIDYIR
ncbi:flagellar hook-associated protein FlgL [Haloimpatiens lingqiaonensis]|uniref:flagellar hook-associated protein FlgL n=1 Tax=Haloimpatiens lingqiaonensis TaxID=1380675 RepID=UPI0010FDF356|nr:flagellar hook-associated protein FlgL [Haloimpatiens lingqiaonensis]